jgi:hypothetical protein
MGYVNKQDDPQLIFELNSAEDIDEVERIARMVRNINQMLVDSGFDQYKYDVEVKDDNAYIKQI